jgi:hypothetical protein
MPGAANAHRREAKPAREEITPTMNPLDIVDELYAAFVDTLHGPLVQCARDLALTLGLVSARGVPWSRVFSHPITLAAPALLSDAMPNVGTRVMRDAILAHMLAVIEAFGTDRVEDGQIHATPDLMALLGQIRRARDRAVHRVAPGVRDAAIDFAAADQRTLYAIACEHGLLRQGSGVSFVTYEMVSLGKQAVGFPATLALAHAAGWDERRRITLRRALASVWLGLQMNDDVVDWEDDFARGGGSWAVALAIGASARDLHDEHTAEASLRKRVFASRALEHMLARARWHFHALRRRSEVLGARELGSWAADRETRLTVLHAEEQQSAGYAVRAHALAAWAGEVLA